MKPNLFCHSFVLLTFLSYSLGYPDGAPADACPDMIPQHGVSGLYEPSFHNLLIAKRSLDFRLGEKVDISLLVPSPTLAKFKGFLITARNPQNEVVGHFETYDKNVKLLSCSAGADDAITHQSNAGKSYINATWVAPYTSERVRDGIVFVYTVVEERNKFWIPQQSHILSYSSGTKTASSAITFLLFSFAMKLIV